MIICIKWIAKLYINMIKLLFYKMLFLNISIWYNNAESLNIYIYYLLISKKKKRENDKFKNIFFNINKILFIVEYSVYKKKT